MENLRPIISGLAGAIIAALLVSWVSREKPAARSPGHFAHGKRYRTLSAFILFIGCSIGYAALYAAESQRKIAFLVAAPLFIFSAWMFLDAFFVRGNVSETTLRIFSPWRGWRTIPLSEVVGYRYSTSLGCHVLSTKANGIVRISAHMDGVDQVAEYLSALPSDDA